jgi:hypothetical protein
VVGVLPLRWFEISPFGRDDKAKVVETTPGMAFDMTRKVLMTTKRKAEMAIELDLTFGPTPSF